MEKIDELIHMTARIIESYVDRFEKLFLLSGGFCKKITFQKN